MTLLRAVAALTAAAAMLVGSALALSSATVLVSNTAQSKAGSATLRVLDAAQDVTTGTNVAGYTLTSIDLSLTTAGANVAVPSVRLVSGSAHAAGGVTLTGPASLQASTTQSYTFTAPEHTRMSASTQYWIVVEGVGDSHADNISFDLSDSTSEDTAFAGWSIGDFISLRNIASTGAFTWGGTADVGGGTLYPPGGYLLSIKGTAVGGL